MGYNIEPKESFAQIQQAVQAARDNGERSADYGGRYMEIAPIGSEGGTLEVWMHPYHGVAVRRGCFSGTLEQFREKVERQYPPDQVHGRIYRDIIERVILAVAPAHQEGQPFKLEKERWTYNHECPCSSCRQAQRRVSAGERATVAT